MDKIYTGCLFTTPSTVYTNNRNPDKNVKKNNFIERKTKQICSLIKKDWHWLELNEMCWTL